VPIADHSLHFPGNRTGFLLIHGLGGTPIELRVVARALHKAGHTVHCPQLAGHCGSEDDLLATTWLDWAASVEAALDQLKRECDTIIVGGLSMGAVMALHIAAKRADDVQGLALYAPTLWYDGWSIPWYSFLLKLLIDTPMGRRFRFVEREPYGIKDPRIRAMIVNAMGRGDSAEAGLLGTPSGAVREMWALIKRVKQLMGTIRQPALIVHARNDDVAGLSNALYIQRHLGGLVDTVVLEDSYHLVTIDGQRDVVIERSFALAQRLTVTAATMEHGAPCAMAAE
jgi:carboxylesterase